LGGVYQKTDYSVYGAAFNQMLFMLTLSY
jgi:hypothetical protein